MKLDDIHDAYMFVNMGHFGDHLAVINRKTGEVHYRSESADMDDIPEDTCEDDNYVEIPHKNEFNLGKALVFDFVNQNLPEEIEQVERIFAKRGAYGRYKDLLESREVLEQWYEFEAQRTDQALRQWCKDNQIDIED